MGNTGSKENIISEEALNEYVELTYLNKVEICQIYKRLDDLEPGILKQNLHYRFSVKQINKILPQIHCNPFCDVIYRVFSSKQDGHLSFEDTLDLCSAFSMNCPQSVRAAWAFEIFEIDPSGADNIAPQEFTQLLSKMSDFAHTFQFKIN
ncbi:Calcium and integrin-binding protein 1 [Trachymyrmex septentrionalis]|uniref:Calcium and integrin-binding protein 1 n=1 Tax=Trachymyrmex septentrionalis TaxID=34720 RepID=A0A195F2U2_9HYME|nr:Calcium and integrin-binding protein 1 [Trachymyrmex septentrionalis]